VFSEKPIADFPEEHLWDAIIKGLGFTVFNKALLSIIFFYYKIIRKLYKIILSIKFD